MALRVNKGKGKAIPLPTWTGPEGFMKARLLETLDIRHMKVVSLSAQRTSSHYPQEKSLVLISVRVRVCPRAMVQPEGLNQ